MKPELRILVVDDEPLARERLATLLADIAARLPNTVVGSVGDGVAALERLADCPADVALIDIKMPRMGGLELASHLRHCKGAPAVIFTTAYDHHAVHAFELNAVDYLLKPIRTERLLAALMKVAARGAGEGEPIPVGTLQSIANEPRRFFSCHDRGKQLLIPVADVLYLRADAKYVAINTLDHEYLLEESLLSIEEEFASYFVRLHRSVLVARNALATVERRSGPEGEYWIATVKGKADLLPVSRRQWPTLKKMLLDPAPR